MSPCSVTPHNVEKQREAQDDEIYKDVDGLIQEKICLFARTGFATAGRQVAVIAHGRYKHMIEQTVSELLGQDINLPLKSYEFLSLIAMNSHDIPDFPCTRLVEG